MTRIIRGLDVDRPLTPCQAMHPKIRDLQCVAEVDDEHRLHSGTPHGEGTKNRHVATRWVRNVIRHEFWDGPNEPPAPPERQRYTPTSIHPRGKRADIMVQMVRHYMRIVMQGCDGVSDREMQTFPGIHEHEESGICRHNIAALRLALEKQGIVHCIDRRVENRSKVMIWSLTPEYVALLDQHASAEDNPHLGKHLRWDYFAVQEGSSPIADIPTHVSFGDDSHRLGETGL